MTDSAVSTPPRTLRWALWASIVWGALTILTALALMTQKPWVYSQLVSANTKAKSPQANYTGGTVDRDVDRVVNIGLAQGAIVAAIIILIAVFVRRGRPWARWLLVGLATIIPLIVPLGIGIFTQLVYGLTASAPLLYKAPLVLAGLASLAVVVILFLPETRAYFARMRPEGRGPGLFGRPAAGAGPRGGGAAGGLGALFRSNRDVAAPEPPSSPPTGASPEQPAPAVVARPPAGKSRTVTRPGSVKPKGGARSKSRQR